MPKLHAFELVPDAVGRETLLADWQALRDADLPSQLDHQGASNTPHVTVLAAPRLPSDDLAAQLVGSLLPLRARTSGVVLLGDPRVTVAYVLDVDDLLTAAVLELRRGVPDLPQHGWLPHVTLGRRIPRTSAAVALGAIGGGEAEFMLTELRRWDPDAGTVTTVARVDDPGLST